MNARHATHADALARLTAVENEYWSWIRQRRIRQDITLQRFEEQADCATAMLERLQTIEIAAFAHEELLTTHVLEWEARRHRDELNVYS